MPKFDFEPLDAEIFEGKTVQTGLPRPLDEEGKNNSLTAYQEIRSRLATAEASGDPDSYLKSFNELIGAMRQEVIDNHQGQHGDLSHTMMSWAHKVQELVTFSSHLAAIKNGRPAKVRSNTLDNHSNPHGTAPGFGRNPTDSQNSLDFGTGVVEFVNTRAGSYLTAQTVEGSPISPGEHLYSTFQVETTAKGFVAT